MIHSISACFIRHMSKHVSLSQNDTAICQYALELAIYTLLSTLGIMLLGLTTGHFLEVIIALGVFYINQTIGGGYHAQNHLNCFISMLFGLSISFGIVWHFQVLTHLITVASFFILFSIPVVLHENKYYLQKKLRTLINQAMLIYSAESIVLLVISAINARNILTGYVIGLVWSSFSRIIGLLLHNSATKGHFH